MVVIDLLSLSGTAEVRLLASAQNRPLLRNQATYQAAADQLLRSSIWNRNKITVDTAGLGRQLTNRFPELASASVSWPLFGHRPTVYLQPIQPGLILAASNGAFMLDTTGKAVLGAATPAVLATTRTTGGKSDASNLQLHVGHQGLPTDESVSSRLSSPS